MPLRAENNEPARHRHWWRSRARLSGGVPAMRGARAFLAPLIFACASFGLSACSTVEDPEDPGFNEPAVTGVLRGDISSVKEYRDAVEKENRRAGRDGPRWNDGFNDEDFRD